MLILFYIKLVTAHLLSDFALQPASWVRSRQALNARSPYLYYHTLVTVITAGVFTQFRNPEILVVIGVSHCLIDLWKSYQRQTAFYFFVDQFLHLFVILLLGAFYFPAEFAEGRAMLVRAIQDRGAWICILALTFLSWPCGVVIGLLTSKWKKQFRDDDNSLGNAGKWIGILERLIIFVLVVFNQYAAIALLTAAKSILRFSDTKDMPQRTEYVLIGTLISISAAMVVGLLVKAALNI